MPIETSLLILGWGLLGAILISAFCLGPRPQNDDAGRPDRLRRRRIAERDGVIASWLTAVATVAAAIAAGASVWTGLQQETATYRSNLYSKQVDALSALFVQTQAVLDFGDAIDEKYHSQALEKPDGRFSLDSSDKTKAGQLFESWSLALDVIKLILPKEYSQNIASISPYIKKFMNYEPSALDWRPAFASPTPGDRFMARGHISYTIDCVQRSASQTLQDGHPVGSIIVSDCH